MAETLADLVRIGEPVKTVILSIGLSKSDSTYVGKTVTVKNESGSTIGSATLDSNYKCTIVVAETGIMTASVTNTSGKTVSKSFVLSKSDLNTTVSITISLAPDMVAWSSATDDQIVDIVNAYYDGTLTLDQIKAVWKVGDTRSISLDAMSTSGTGAVSKESWSVGESHRAQTVEITIADFDHDTLSTATGGKTKALLTWTQKNCLRASGVSDTGGSSNGEHGYMNSSNTNSGSWNGCARRKWCNGAYYDAFPSKLKGLLKQVNKQTCQSYSSSTLQTSKDYIFLPSEWEIFGSRLYAVAQEGTQYSYYTTTANRYKLPKWSSGDSSDVWWERSPCSGYSNAFCMVYFNGNADYGYASYSYGLAPFGCF